MGNLVTMHEIINVEMVGLFVTTLGGDSHCQAFRSTTAKPQDSEHRIDLWIVVEI